MKLPSASLWIRILGGLLILIVILLVLFGLRSEDAPTRALVSMITGLILLWVGISGGLMLRGRGRIREAVLKLSFGWRAKLLLMTILLALVEEAVHRLDAAAGLLAFQPLRGLSAVRADGDAGGKPVVRDAKFGLIRGVGVHLRPDDLPAGLLPA